MYKVVNLQPVGKVATILSQFQIHGSCNICTTLSHPCYNLVITLLRKLVATMVQPCYNHGNFMWHHKTHANTIEFHKETSLAATSRVTLT